MKERFSRAFLFCVMHEIHVDKDDICSVQLSVFIASRAHDNIVVFVSQFYYLILLIESDLCMSHTVEVKTYKHVCLKKKKKLATKCKLHEGYSWRCIFPYEQR